MSSTYFVSDQHFTRGSGESQEAFVALCRRLETEQGARLVILGDLFHYWLKAEEINRRSFATVLDALQSLSLCGVEIHFFIGNHDFLFRPAQDWRARLVLHRQGQVMTLGPRRFYVTHGDDLCRADWGYRLMKPIIRSKVAERVFALLPCAIQEGIANLMSRMSRDSVEKKSQATLRISLFYCRELIARDNLDGIVHGHAHGNSLQKLEVAGRSAILLSVGPWEGKERPVWRYSQEQDRWEELNAG